MNGLLLVNKPVGLTSHDVVAKVRRALKTKEVGHSGTLDPIASGLMVLLVGEATKLSSYVTEGDKSYRVGIQFGIETDTLDTTGNVVKEHEIRSAPENISQIAQALVGEFEMEIPLFSAKKIDGKKLYEYARAGEQIELPRKKMKFWDVESVNEAEFHLHCSKGSFIRSWVQTLGRKAGTGACMRSLVRTSSHKYNLNNSIELSALEQIEANDLGKLLIPVDQALGGVKSIRVSGQNETLMRNGQISHALRRELITKFNPAEDEIIQILPQERGKLLALIGLEAGFGFRIKRIFNC